MLAKSSPDGVSPAKPFQSRFLRWGGFFIVCLAVMVAACSHDGAATLDSARYVANAFKPGGGADPLPTRLDPRYRYLRVQSGEGAPSLLVLGYVDPHPLGPIEVWYSAAGEVLKLQNGRVVATQGLLTDWPSVRFERAPTPWEQVGPQGSTYLRLRDETPSYRYGVRQTVAIRPFTQAPTLQGRAPLAPQLMAQYRWYQESVQSSDGGASVSWFALGMHRGVKTIVFSEQCIGPHLCLHIQPWPVDEGNL